MVAIPSRVAKQRDGQRQSDKRKACKIKQIDELKTAITKSVKEEFKSYSSVVQQSLPKEPVLNTTTLQTVVKRVEEEEEDGSRNLVIFGLVEKVGEVFETLVRNQPFKPAESGKKSKTDKECCR